jgi:hypothetical protein
MSRTEDRQTGLTEFFNRLFGIDLKICREVRPDEKAKVNSKLKELFPDGFYSETRENINPDELHFIRVNRGNRPPTYIAFLDPDLNNTLSVNSEFGDLVITKPGGFNPDLVPGGLIKVIHFRDGMITGFEDTDLRRSTHLDGLTIFSAGNETVEVKPDTLQYHTIVFPKPDYHLVLVDVNGHRAKDGQHYVNGINVSDQQLTHQPARLMI